MLIKREKKNSFFFPLKLNIQVWQKNTNPIINTTIIEIFNNNRIKSLAQRVYQIAPNKKKKNKTRQFAVTHNYTKKKKQHSKPCSQSKVCYHHPMQRLYIDGMLRNSKNMKQAFITSGIHGSP